MRGGSGSPADDDSLTEAPEPTSDRMSRWIRAVMGHGPQGLIRPAGPEQQLKNDPIPRLGDEQLEVTSANFTGRLFIPWLSVDP